jgi:hypothetical protein
MEKYRALNIWPAYQPLSVNYINVTFEELKSILGFERDCSAQVTMVGEQLNAAFTRDCMAGCGLPGRSN